MSFAPFMFYHDICTYIHLHINYLLRVLDANFDTSLYNKKTTKAGKSEHETILIPINSSNYAKTYLEIEISY